MLYMPYRRAVHFEDIQKRRLCVIHTTSRAAAQRIFDSMDVVTQTYAQGVQADIALAHILGLDLDFHTLTQTDG